LKINKEEVDHVAHLSRLEFSEEEVEKFTLQMDKILSYIDKLNQVNTTGVEPMTHAIPTANAFREDIVTPSLTDDAALVNGPEIRDGSFRVPKVIE